MYRGAVRGFAYLAASVITAVAIGVAILAITTPLGPQLSTPSEVGLAYLSYLKAENCNGAESLFIDRPSRLGCPLNPTITSPHASARSIPANVCKAFGCRQAFAVTVTFKSRIFGWVGYSPTPPRPHLPVTVGWTVLVGEMPDGHFWLLPTD
jgi:hypothetical protein